ncbi:MAG: hypothetical protein Q8936_15225 [Bacillota bacterium]|nr:hypothetical protein [Bacillota bacterium]
MRKLTFVAFSLAEGAVIIPNLIFVGLIYNHYGNYSYIFPFVLLYAFEKAGIFSIKGFGELLNPYPMVKRLMILTFVGSIFMMAGIWSHILWDIGAILIGVGLSAYPALFRTIVDIQKELNISTDQKAVNKAYLFLLVFIAVVISIRHTHYSLIFLLFFIYITLVCLYIWKLEIPDSLINQPIFRKKKNSKKYFTASLLILLFALGVRFLKQTANVYFILLVFLVLCIFIFALNIPQKRSLNKSSLHTLLIGGIRNYLTIYSLIFFTAIGQSTKVMISYALITAGMFISMLFTQKLNNVLKLTEPFKFYPMTTSRSTPASISGVLRLLRPWITISNLEAGFKTPSQAKNSVYLLGSCFGMILMLIPYCYFIGITVSAFFVTSANKDATHNIITEENIAAYEKRLVKARFYGLGAIIQQAVFLIVLLSVSFFLNGKANLALSAYVYLSATPQLTTTFHITGLICTLITVACSLILTKNKP